MLAVSLTRICSLARQPQHGPNLQPRRPFCTANVGAIRTPWKAPQRPNPFLHLLFINPFNSHQATALHLAFSQTQSAQTREIEVNIAADLQAPPRRLHHDRFEAALKQMPAPSMPPIEPNRVAHI